MTCFAMVSYFILFLFRSTPTGFMTLLMVILFLGSIQLFCFSIIAEYLAQIFEEIKNRPINVVKGILNDQRKTPREWLGTRNGA